MLMHWNIDMTDESLINDTTSSGQEMILHNAHGAEAAAAFVSGPNAQSINQKSQSKKRRRCDFNRTHYNTSMEVDDDLC